jgi:NAD(P)-dependent dehydrogenase (short-subunit alcohol dehydrogenase family)
MDLSPFSLAGKRALVTGGGRGIGAACAQALAQAGAEVAVASRTASQLQEVVDAIENQGGQAHALPADLGATDDIDRLVDAVYQKWDHLDILVNNAAISPIFKRSTEVSDEEWQQILHVNLDGVFQLTRNIGRRMVERQSGTVVNMTSIGAVRALPRLAPYSVGKAALDQLTRILAVEWATSGVRVNAVAPAYIETAMTEGIHESEHLRQEVEARTPMGRFGQPADVAWAVVFLASDAASYITGHTLFVDGGWTSL